MDQTNQAACKLSEIADGEMKEVQVGSTPVLLARVDGRCYALAAHCTHYGAPLAEGYLSGDRIVCPWHHACFNARTGALEEPPALDSVENYPIRIEDDNIFVDLPEGAPDRRTPPMAKRDADDTRTFAIIGGGAAGYMAAQTLREEGFAGRILIITRESRAPYDRPNLSKDYLHGHAEPAWMPLRGDDFYGEHDIEFVFGKDVANVDAKSRKITFPDGETMDCDAVLVATGGEPRRLQLPGADLENVFVLRSFDSADSIIAAAADAKNAVVIGASFIAMETAFSLRERGLDVTVIAPDKVPFERTLGPEIGRVFQSVHEANGVKFRLGEHVIALKGESKVDGVELESGDIVNADIVIVGIGVSPATAFLKGFEKQKDGSVKVDEFMSLGNNIFAAGDIATFVDARSGEPTRIEHWRTALQQGRIAAKNMLGRQVPNDSVPFFWTTQFDVTLNYVGHASGWDSIEFQGDVDKKDFLAFYIKNGNVTAVAGMNRDRDLAVWEERFRLGRVPSPAELANENVSRAAV
jgi:NADPH-dependent 2,4-dienoyl-CoA reductase/sulfur reductase-like enzyme/nitrite reductase/ring-hydroxylating ferredoxin subunit